MSKGKKASPTRTVLIRKQARGFRVGEILYLYGCDTPNYGRVSGTFLIREIKQMADTTVTFMVHTTTFSIRSYALEFLRNQPLHRISGPLVTTIIEESP